MAAEYEKLPVPGYTQGDTYTDVEILYSYARFTQKGVTLKGGQGVLLAGTLLARKTSDKKYYVYNNAAADGTEVARGVLRRGVDTGPAGSVDQVSNMVISGIVKSNFVSGAGANAIPDAVSDLNAKLDTVMGTFTI